MVRFNVTILSQPLADPPKTVSVAVVLFEVYVTPSIHVKVLQAVCKSIPVVVGVMVRFKVTILSQPLADPPKTVSVAVVLFEV